MHNHLKKYLHTKKKKCTFEKCCDEECVNEIKHDI